MAKLQNNAHLSGEIWRGSTLPSTSSTSIRSSACEHCACSIAAAAAAGPPLVTCTSSFGACTWLLLWFFLFGDVEFFLYFRLSRLELLVDIREVTCFLVLFLRVRSVANATTLFDLFKSTLHLLKVKQLPINCIRYGSKMILTSVCEHPWTT